jgi:hypothetical protein
MGNGVHYLDRLITSVGRSDISSQRYTAWKLERLLLLWSWQPRSHEVFDESGYPHPEAAQLGMHAVRDHDRLDALYTAGQRDQDAAVVDLFQERSRARRHPRTQGTPPALGR